MGFDYLHYIKSFNITFIFIPRTASKSLRRFIGNNVDDALIIKNQLAHVNAQYVLDNKLVPKDSKFIGVIRDPLEKTLSSYFQMIQSKNSQYSNVSFKDIIKMNGGFAKKSTSPHTAQQHTFLEYKGNCVGDWWCYDYLQDHVHNFSEEYDIEVKSPLGHKHQTIKNEHTKDVMSFYYDDETYKLVSDYYEKDIQLYNEVREKWSLIYNEQ